MNLASTMRRRLSGAMLALALAGPAAAATITLGDQDFADGTIVSGFTFLAAQGGEPPPMGVVVGGDTAGIFYTASWTFNFAPGAASTASITFGMFDHDSAAPGSQLASFMIDGVDLTAALDALFEAPGVGTQLEVNVFSLALSGAALVALADGSATFSLTLQGPALCGAGGTADPCTSPGNAAALDFSRLDYEQGNVVPEPGTLALFAAAVGALMARRRPRA